MIESSYIIKNIKQDKDAHVYSQSFGHSCKSIYAFVMWLHRQCNFNVNDMLIGNDKLKNLFANFV